MSGTYADFVQRKTDHIELATQPKHQATGLSGLSSVRLIHEALPECDFSSVHLLAQNETKISTILNNKALYVAGMTAGHVNAQAINHRLAQLCETYQWTFGLGSLRRQFEVIQAGSSRTDPSLQEVTQLQKKFKNLKFLSNIGLSQLAEFSDDTLRQAVDLFEPTAFCIHLNALQEVIQPNGTPNFKNGLKNIERAVRLLPIPVIVKETGCGISTQTATRLIDVGVSAIDVSGLGGTHWGRIEGSRADRDSVQQRAADVFQNWGIPLVDSLLMVKKVLPKNVELWASGGIRTGLDAAKCLALGADRVGFAQPALLAVQDDFTKTGAADQWFQQIEYEIRLALFCTGSTNPRELKNKGAPWVR